jgi:hypothetical protein
VCECVFVRTQVLTAEGIEDKDAVDEAGFSEVVNRSAQMLGWHKCGNGMCLKADPGSRLCEKKLRKIFVKFSKKEEKKRRMDP